MQEIRNKTFFTVVGFEKADQWATFDKDGISSIEEAKQIAEQLKKSGFEHVVIRQEDIILRNENNEFSSSTPILTF